MHIQSTLLFANSFIWCQEEASLICIKLLNVINCFFPILSANGADPNIRTKRGRAPIHCAALYGHTEVLSLLITHGAKVNIQVSEGNSINHELRKIKLRKF